MTLGFGMLLKHPLLGSIDRCFAHLAKNVRTVFELLEKEITLTFNIFIHFALAVIKMAFFIQKCMEDGQILIAKEINTKTEM